MCERDTGRVLVAVAQGASAGREPRQLAEAVLGHLRDALVATLAPDVVLLPDDAKELVADQGRRLGIAATVRAMDALGEAIQQMRESPDPRVALEVALVRCTRVELDSSPAALVERLERLERSGRTAAPAPTTAEPEPAARPAPRSSAERPTLGALRNKTTAAAATAAPTAKVTAAPAAVSTGTLPTRDAITTAWADAVLPKLKPKVKGLFASGRFIAVEDGAAVFALQYESHISLATPVKPDVEAALAAHFGAPVPLRLVVDPGGPAKDTPVDDVPEETVDLDGLTDAPPDNRTGIDHLNAAFGEVEVVEGEK